MATVKAFYAYPSGNESLKEDIAKAVKNINATKAVKITRWEDLNVTGKHMIDVILKTIDDSDLFICDLTFLNFNVLFELGYAVGKKKKIWITLNETHNKSTSNYRQLKSLTTIGYAGYNNADELKIKFFKENPHQLAETINIQDENLGNTKSLVYLKCGTGTTASTELTSLVQSSKLPLLTADPYEGRNPLSWYVKALQNSLGVLVHFHTLNQDGEVGEDIFWSSEKAMVAGIAQGLDLNLLILAHEPYETPLDYHDHLHTHKTSKKCVEISETWLEPLINKRNNMKEENRQHKAGQKALNSIKSLIIGDHVAENEPVDLIEYFVETAEYKEALKSQQVLFVGRKGTGKTANLIKIKDELSSDKRNFVCSIQPQGHEFEGVLNILEKTLTSSEQGHLIESIWKFLIYTELAKSYYEYLCNQPPQIPKTNDELELEDFIKKNEKLINADFTLRLENAVTKLKLLDYNNEIDQQRVKVSEILHSKIISHLRQKLGKVFHSKERVCILIDNLDKNWSDNVNLERLSQLLFGLLNVGQRITDEFRMKNYKQVDVELSLIAFLRSDIFTRVMKYANERDKIPYKNLSWTEPNLLFKVIEQRIEYNIDEIPSPEVLWRDYFCETVNGQALKDYITSFILPRPRDIIILFKMAFQEAINKEHAKVEEEDFKAAEFKYSEYALQSLLPENGNRIPELESVFYEFAGHNSIIDKNELENCLVEWCTADKDTKHIIEVLCELTFLGLEVAENKFEYFSEKRPKKITENLARKLVLKNKKNQRYEINPAFHAYLEINKVELMKV